MRLPWVRKVPAHYGLIIDVGANNGDDSAFYLKKGFRVVGVEADPTLVAALQERFKNEIASGDFVLIDKAIAEKAGTVTFYSNAKNNEWGTIDERFANRNLSWGAPSTTSTVDSIPFSDILDEFGVPYYLKIDVEGVDLLCVKALMSYADRPKYISLEISLTSADEALEEIGTIAELGYRHFKITNQYLNDRLSDPIPAKEGRSIEHKFQGHSNSGLFGEETMGPWMDLDQAKLRAELIVAEQAFFGGHGTHNKTPEGQKYLELRSRSGDPVGWYDVHAKL